MFTRKEQILRRCVVIGVRLLLAATIVFISALPGAAATCDRMQVSYEKGQLAIHSAGCSLQQVLEAIQEKMEIQLNFPASTASSTITVDLAAGDPAAVVTALLQPTKFNFALAGGEGSPLTFVIVTERSSAPIPVALPVQPSKPAPALTAAAKPPSGSATDKDKKSKEEKDKKTIKASGDLVADEDSGGKKRMEIDEDTLKKLPPLPPGVPTAMWGLYPELVANGGRPPEGPPQLPGGASADQLSAQAAATTPGGAPVSNYFEDPPMGPKGVIGLPTLPPDIDPNMGKIYPWNLMQLINSPIKYPDIKLPPMAPPIGVGTPIGQH